MLSISISSFFLLILTLSSFNNKSKLIDNTLLLLSNILALGLVWLPFINYQEIKFFPLIIISTYFVLFFFHSFFQSKITIKLLIICLSLISVFLFPDKVKIHEYSFETDNLLLISILVFSIVFSNPLANFGDRLINYFATSEIDSKFHVQSFLNAAIILLLYFKFSYMGIGVGLSSFILNGFVFSENTSKRNHFYLYISLAFGFWLIAYKAEMGLFEGATLFTILTTASSYFIYSKFYKITKTNTVHFLVLSGISLLMFFPVILGQLNPIFGGFHYLSLILILLAVFEFSEFRWNERSSIFLISFLTFFGVIIHSSSEEKNKLKSLHKNIEFKKTAWQGELVFEKANNSERIDLNGAFKIKNSPMNFQFELGPNNSRTKGKFEIVEGLITLNEDLTKCKFDISIPIKGLTTFDEMRDEYLMEEDFFNAVRYQSIKFKSESFVLKENFYELNGKMTMIGVEKDITIKMKYNTKSIDDQKIPLLTGVGNVDRTLFGMEPDASIGNLVDFNFEILLEKQ